MRRLSKRKVRDMAKLLQCAEFAALSNVAVQWKASPCHTMVPRRLYMGAGKSAECALYLSSHYCAGAKAGTAANAEKAGASLGWRQLGHMSHETQAGSQEGCNDVRREGVPAQIL